MSIIVCKDCNKEAFKIKLLVYCFNNNCKNYLKFTKINTPYFYKHFCEIKSINEN